MRSPADLGFWRRLGKTEAITAEVRAELEHHLARATEDLVATGLAPEVARAEARRRFGDLERIEHDCLQIQTGGLTMLHRIHAGATLLLFLSVLFLLYDGRMRAARSEALAQQFRQEAELAMHRAEEARRGRNPVESIVIRVGDRLELVDFVNPDLNVSEEVAADGKILVPDLGWFAVAGLTREEAEAALSEALGAYFVSVDVKLKVHSEESD